MSTLVPSRRSLHTKNSSQNYPKPCDCRLDWMSWSQAEEVCTQRKILRTTQITQHPPEVSLVTVNWEGLSIPHDEQLSISNCFSFLTPSLPGFVHAICQSNSEQVIYLHYFSCSSLSLKKYNHKFFHDSWAYIILQSWWGEVGGGGELYTLYQRCPKKKRSLLSLSEGVWESFFFHRIILEKYHLLPPH